MDADSDVPLPMNKLSLHLLHEPDAPSASTPRFFASPRSLRIANHSYMIPIIWMLTILSSFPSVYALMLISGSASLLFWWHQEVSILQLICTCACLVGFIKALTFYWMMFFFSFELFLHRKFLFLFRVSKRCAKRSRVCCTGRLYVARERCI